MTDVDPRSEKAILHAEAARQRISLTRYEPAEPLRPFVERYWLVRWNLADQPPYTQTVLSYPNVQIAFERDSDGDESGVYGVPSTVYSRLLKDEGFAFGVKFHPGSFYPFWNQPASLLTGRIASLREIFGDGAASLQDRVLAETDGERMADIVDGFLVPLIPADADDTWVTMRKVVETIEADREITKVEHLSARFGLSPRTAQRLFGRYVGVSPKWVIKRFRLQEAADLLKQGGSLDLHGMAQELGYYDQAHFIKDFKAMIGQSPLAYMKQA